MNRGKKKICSWLMACVMVLAVLPGIGLKAEAAATSYDVRVGDTDVTSDTLSGSGWRYDPTTSTLTLTDFECAMSELNDQGVIYARHDLNLVLEGRNKVTNTATSKKYGELCGIGVFGGTLTISGNGILSLTGKDKAYYIGSTESEGRSYEEEKDGQLYAKDFIFTPPAGIYNGKAKSATVTPKKGISCGDVTVKYYNEQGQQVTGEPAARGTYTVKIDVAENDTYVEATDLTDASWTFTIDYGTLTGDMYILSGISDGGWAKDYVTISGADGYMINNTEMEDHYQPALNYNQSREETLYVRETTTGNIYKGTVNLEFQKDTKAPVITGLKDGEMYWNTDVFFTVTDDESGVAKVTTRPQSGGTEISLTPEEDGTYRLTGRGWYTIRAYDKVGNSTGGVDVCVSTCDHNSVFKDVTYEWNRDAAGMIVSCTAKGTCWNCEQEVTETVTAESQVTQEQSCTEPELTTYTVRFQNSRFDAQKKADVVTKPAAHQLEKVGAKEATCTAEGHQEYYRCKVCDKCFKDAEAAEPVTEEEMIIGRISHDLDKVEAKAPICTETGNKAYYKCKVCGGCFADAEGKAQINEVDMKLEKIPHEGDADTVRYTWGEDAKGNITCTAVITCKRCPEVLATDNGTVTSRIVKKATCTEEGKRTYTAAFPKGAGYIDQTKDVPISALGHTPKADDGDCTTAVTCERCDHVFVEAKAEHNWSSSWEKDASGHWHTCRNEGCTKTDKHDHTPDMEAPTEDTDQVCKECGWIIANKLGHLHRLHLEEIKAKEVTCTEDGNKAYYRCTEDQKCFLDKNAETEVNESEMIIRADGHEWDDPVYTWSKDLTSCSAVQRCKNCEMVKESETAGVISEVTQEQSCTDPEITTYTAAFTSENFAAQKKEVQTRKAAGHHPGDWIIDREATATAVGSRHKECTVCKAVLETEVLEKLTAAGKDNGKKNPANSGSQSPKGESRSTSTVPVTADNSQGMFWLVMSFVSASALVLSGLRRKQRR